MLYTVVNTEKAKVFIRADNTDVKLYRPVSVLNYLITVVYHKASLRSHAKIRVFAVSATLCFVRQFTLVGVAVGNRSGGRRFNKVSVSTLKAVLVVRRSAVGQLFFLYAEIIKVDHAGRDVGASVINVTKIKSVTVYTGS